ncbi:MAG TPA: hypothetical protein VF112_08085 [Candidatus Dormibacteraeota bacterium]
MQDTSTRRARRRGLALALGGIVAAAVLAGCGKAANASTTGSNSSASKADAGLKFAQCMRSHGIDVPDPSTSGNGGAVQFHIGGSGGGGGINPDSTTFQQAQSACQKYLPNGGRLTPQQQQQAQQNALQYAQCMRAHGVDVPDPSTRDGGVMFSLGGSINPDDPAFQSAQQACSSKLGGIGGKVTIHGGGPAPAGGGSGGSVGFGTVVGG